MPKETSQRLNSTCGPPQISFFAEVGTQGHRCTLVPFGSVLVMAVYAPDCRKDLDVYDKCVTDVTKVLCEGRRAGAKKFHIAGGLNVELGLLCTGDDEIVLPRI